MNEEFPTDVKDFIHQNIQSLAHLEVLLTLHREPGRCWTAEELTARLYLQQQMVADLLQDLVQRGFVTEQNSAFCFAKLEVHTQAIMDRLAELYKERRVSVAAEIFANREDSARAFAAAFRLRRKE